MFKLHKLKLLQKDMKQKKWTICSFLFCYNKIEYIVLVRRFMKHQEPKSRLAAVMLDFIKADDLDKKYIF